RQGGQRRRWQDRTWTEDDASRQQRTRRTDYELLLLSNCGTSPKSVARRCRRRSWAHPPRDLASSGNIFVRAADAAVAEAGAVHLMAAVNVAQVDEERGAHGGPEAGEVDLAKGRPLGDEDDGVGVLRDVVGAAAEADDGQQGARRVHALGVVGGDLGAAGPQVLDDAQRGRLAHVVGVGLKGEAENGDALAGDTAADRVDDLFDHDAVTGGV